MFQLYYKSGTMVLQNCNTKVVYMGKSLPGEQNSMLTRSWNLHIGLAADVYVMLIRVNIVYKLVTLKFSLF